MKKVVSIVAMTLVVVMALGLFAACGYSGDPQKDKEKLEDKDYTVVLVDGSESALVQTGLDAVALTLGLTGSGKLVATIEAGKSDDNGEEYVSIWYFDSNESANTAWDSKVIKAARDAAEKNEDENVSASVKKSGKMIISEGKTTKEAGK